MMTVGIVLFMMISFMGISSSTYAGVENHTNGLPVPVFGSYTATNNTGSSTSSPAPMSVHGPPGGGGGGGGGGSPSTVTVTFYIFDGQGEISLDGVVYANDDNASLTEGTWYSISANNLGSGYSFYEWLADNGTVSNSQSSSTTFTPSSTGTLTMIIERGGQPYQNWAGYEETSNGLTQASAIIDVPSSISYVNGVWNANTNEETVSFWVGLGGDPTVTNGDLWQAGVSIQMNSSGSIWLYTWYEYVGSATDNYKGIYPVPIFNIYPGDVIYIDISVSNLYNLYNEKGNYVIKDETQGFYASGQVSLPNDFFYGDPLTAEWIVEDPAVNGNYNYFVIPDFGSATFQSVESGSSAGMNVPYLYLFSPVLNEKVTVDWNYGEFDQGLTPGTTNSIDFTVSYSQWSV